MLKAALVAAAILCASAPVPASAQTAAIHPGHSAVWYNPERSGEGWVLEVLDGEMATMYWFTYDGKGNQRWLTGVGSVNGASIVFAEVLVTRGGRFGPDFDPDEVVREIVGQVTFRFNDCATGTVEYQVFGQSDVIPVQRLTRTMAVECPPLTGRPVRTQGAHSGSWFDPAHSGEGFAVQWLDRGVAVVTWFTYDPDGNQFWITGVGEVDGDGRLVIPDLHATRGARFGTEFDPDDVERFAWGELVLELGCAGGPAKYESELPEFGSGSQQLVRLTALAVVDCPLFMPAVGEIDDVEWDKRFHIAGVSNSFFDAPMIYDFARTDSGEMLAAGAFTWFGQEIVPPLLQRSAATGEWASAGLDVDALAITALANDPNHGLALATQDGGIVAGSANPRGSILLAGPDGPRAIGRFQGIMRRLVWHEGRLWAAGWFQIENGGPSHLAVWDGTRWLPPPGGEPDEPVFALETDGEGLLVGGEFHTVGGIDALSVARFDGEAWTAFDLSGRVFALERFGDDLFAAGFLGVPDFDASSGGVARWNGTDWVLVGDGLSIGTGRAGVVFDLKPFRGDLYALGCISHANGPPDFPDSEPALDLSRWTGSRWESLNDGQRFSPPFFIVREVCGWEQNPGVAWMAGWQRLATDGEILYIGSGLPGFDGVDSHSLMAFDGENFIAQGKLGLGRSGGYTSQLAIGGPDDGVYGLVRVFDGPEPMSMHVARFDDVAGWHAFGPPLPGNDTCRVVSDGLAISPVGEIFIGCVDLKLDTDPSGLSSVPRVLHLADGQWNEVAGAGELRSPLNFTIRFDPDGRLWIAGGLIIGDKQEGFVARLEKGAFRVIDDRFDGPVNQLSFAPEPNDDGSRSLVAGGTFTRIGELEVNYIARWDGQAWQELGEGLATVPSAVEYGTERIYASANPSGDEGLVLGAWDGRQWTELATPDANFPSVDGTPWFGDIRQVGDRLFLAGNVVPPMEDWTEFGPRLYVYDDGKFRPLGGGVVGFADRMEIRHDAVWFVGVLIEADPAGQPASTLGLGRLFWP